MAKHTRRTTRYRKASTRKRQRGGGLKEEALAYLKSQGMTPMDLLQKLHKRQNNGSYKSGTNSMGGYTFKSGGHPAQMVYLSVKKNANNNSKYTTIFSNSDH